MEDKTYKITQEKHDELIKELETRKTSERKSISERLIAARELGDLKENAEYHAMRDEQGRNESRIGEIEEILKHAEIIKNSSNGNIDLASIVTVKKLSDNKELTFTLVGDEEADMLAKKLSISSPLGSALVDKTEGDSVVVSTKKGDIEYLITKVS